MSDLDDLRTLTVEAVAEVLGVHAESVRRWVRDGSLQAARWGGRLHITAAAVRAFQEAHRILIPDAADFIRRQRRRGTDRPGRCRPEK